MKEQYPVLGNRPINQWKVTELKDELKRRGLTIKGLKNDLIKRLADAIRDEGGDSEGESSDGADNSVPNNSERPVVSSTGESSKPLNIDSGPNLTDEGTVQVEESTENTVDADDVPSKIGQVEVQEGEAAANVINNGDVPASETSKELVEDENKAIGGRVDDGDSPAETGQGEVERGSSGTDTLLAAAAAEEQVVVLNELAPNNQVNVPTETDKGKAEEEISGTTLFRPVTEESVLVTCIESNILVDETVVIEISPIEEDSERNKIEPMQDHSEILPADDVVVAEKTEMDVSVEDAVNLDISTADGVTAVSNKGMGNEPSEPLEKDSLLSKLAPNNQVREVSSNVGNENKFDSNSTSSVPVFGKNVLEDDSNVANVHLQKDAVKEEMDQLPSGGLPDDGNFHATENEKSYPNQDLGEKADIRTSTPIDFSENIISGDASSSIISKVEQNMVDDLISEKFENKTIDLVHESTELTDLSGPNQKDGNHSAGFGLSSDKMEICGEGTVLIDETKPQGQDPSERTHVEDEGPFEKINVDPSSTDDSMDEDTSEAKQLVSNPKSVERANNVSTDLPSKKYGTIDAVGSEASSLEKMEISSRKTDSFKYPAKRKFQDEVATSNKEPPKRQRNWPSNVLATGESGSSKHSPSAGNKNSSASALLKHNIAKADSALDASKEHIVPPSQKPPTNSLRIDNFLRPFTVKAVQQLLSKTGEFSSFWMDQIKTHCYVTYSSVEEAVETRNSIYNLQWPPNGGRLLVAEFVDQEDVKSRVEAPTATESQPPMGPPGSTRENILKDSLLPEAPTRHTPPTSNLPRTKERLPVPVPPPQHAEIEEEPPIATLDVLFRKTRETPRIYYLPLTDEEVASKLSRKRRG